MPNPLQHFHDFPVGRKLGVLVVLIALGIAGLCIVAAYTQYRRLYRSQENTLQREVDLALSIVRHQANLAKSGQMSEAEAKARALSTLEQAKANGGVDYFFVHDMTPIMLMHPLRKDLVGKNIANVRTSDGVLVYREQVAQARKGGGFVRFLWPKPGSDRQLPKESYVVAYAPWGWVICSGMYLDDIQKQALVFTGIMTLAGAVLIFTVIGLSWLIGQRITRPLHQATTVAEAIASGHLDTRIGAQHRDEPGRLLDSMRTMQTQVKAVIDAETEMAHRHDQGQISYRMDASGFPGGYGRMVGDTNALVASHIEVTLRLVQVMSQYAVGDLSTDMDRLPGERAVLTQTMDKVKHNLQAINDEIQRLAAAASTGDLSTRGDEHAFSHDFRKMIQGLNQLVGVVDGSLAATGSQLRAIAGGDLSRRIEGDHQGVFGQLRDNINATTAQLAGIVGQIQQASTAITSAAGEVASGNDDLSRRTEQQAANLEETAASMEELTSTVKHNAESAAQANQLAQGATAVARDGGEVATQVVTSMQRIETSSKKIAEIISVIDGIAFQTNILALNAAVEAARAGEQGRGFAVVASEVRALSQRSAEAARQIKALIDTAVGEVGTGSALVARAGTTMQDIVTRVQQVTDLIAEISAASQEQSAGIEQVNQTVTQMDQATQQNAALVEESNAATHSMQDQAEALTKAVVVFKLA